MNDHTFYKASEIKKEIGTLKSAIDRLADTDLSEFSHIVVCAKDNTRNVAIPSNFNGAIIKSIVTIMSDQMEKQQKEYDAL